LLCLVLAPLLALPEGALGNPAIYKRGLRSVAWVVQPRGKGMAWGTGTLVNDKEKIILTNYHVVGDQDGAIVFFPAYNGNDLITEPEHYLKNATTMGVKGKVVARSKSADLALIQLDVVPKGVVPLPLADRSSKPGDALHALGNSGVSNGVLWRYCKGEVRQVFMSKFKLGDPVFEVNARIVETQIPINQGDSGGPVLNDHGELAAVTESFDTKQRLVSMSIDVSEVRTFLAKEKFLPQNPDKKKGG
jgi:serine protease Do